MGASGWSYYVAYRPDLQSALDELRRQVFDAGDYWWAARHEFGKSAADYPDRPETEDELWDDESVLESGTHSILDVLQVVTTGGEPDPMTVHPVSEAEALETIGVAKPTRAHVNALEPLAEQRWVGRCAVLHDAAGVPTELYFWGFSGD